MSNLRENLAELCHDQWSGWMTYLFSKCIKDGKQMTIPEWAVDRWQWQASKTYDELSEAEKESDRAEADRFITLLKGGDDE
jgi:hypothetical protein|tara:strand:+ start:245 stop:487 length:243 start_codon:yes stop_codon:yes gene_type:complete